MACICFVSLLLICLPCRQARVDTRSTCWDQTCWTVCAEAPSRPQWSSLGSTPRMHLNFCLVQPYLKLCSLWWVNAWRRCPTRRVGSVTELDLFGVGFAQSNGVKKKAILNPCSFYLFIKARPHFGASLQRFRPCPLIVLQPINNSTCFPGVWLNNLQKKTKSWPWSHKTRCKTVTPTLRSKADSEG